MQRQKVEMSSDQIISVSDMPVSYCWLFCPRMKDVMSQQHWTLDIMCSTADHVSQRSNKKNTIYVTGNEKEHFC